MRVQVLIFSIETTDNLYSGCVLNSDKGRVRCHEI